jgi:hypothetical protein
MSNAMGFSLKTALLALAATSVKISMGTCWSNNDRQVNCEVLDRLSGISKHNFRAEGSS